MFDKKSSLHSRDLPLNEEVKEVVEEVVEEVKETSKRVFEKTKEIIHPINVRTEPTIQSPAVRCLGIGERVQVKEEKGGWGRIADGEWINLQFTK